MPLVRLTVFAAAILFAAAVGPPPAAADSPLYTVADVEVDVTASSASAARAQAIDDGHRKAFRRLLERIVPRNRLDQVPRLSADELANYVRDFEVFDERTSNVRYLASLTFRFHADSVRQFLRGNEISFAETRSKPVIVLPVWGREDNAVLWDDPNPWRQAWADQSLGRGLVPLNVPLGDLGDIRTISAVQALEPDEAALAGITKRYNGNDVLVTQARVAGDPEAGTASMQVITMRVGTPEFERTLVDNIQQQVDEPLEDMLARAATRVMADIEESWKRANLLSFDDKRTIHVEVPLDGLSRWVTVRDRLAGVARISTVSLDMLSRHMARLGFDYFGDVEQLRVALAQRDLVLERMDGAKGPRDSADSSATMPSEMDRDGWRLRAAEMPPPAARADERPAETGDAGRRTTEGVTVRELASPQGNSSRQSGDSGGAAVE